VEGNDLVNLCGPTFPMRLRAAAGCDTRGLVAAFEAARQVLRFAEAWRRVSQPAAVRRAAGWIKEGAPKDIAHSVALMRPLTQGTAVTDLAAAQGWSLAGAAFVYHGIGGTFGFDKLRAAAGSRAGGDPYERLAVRRLIEDMLAEQTALAGAVMAFAGAGASVDDRPADGEDPAARGKAAIHAWVAAHPAPVKAARRTVEEIEKAGGGWSFAKLTIANAALREMAAG